ncbi:MAG: class I SAM-dependent methyltransferase [Neisseriaceae bacterium]|nr:class I SAM-dependent methyltransferase [Neisseriaceae bacterium]
MELYLSENHVSCEKYLQAILQGIPIAITFRQPESPYYLAFENNRILLKNQQTAETLDADFVTGRIAHRTRFRGHESIAKACAVHQYHHIWDATGGLGQDAFVLASLGANVDVFERNPVAATLLLDALHRAQQSTQTAEIIQRISFHFGSIGEYATQAKPDVIYLDPMFPERRKSAQVKKAMRFFQEIIGDDEDSGALLSTARNLAKHRIVVKRPLRGEFLDAISPAYQYTGKSTRFDVYLPFVKAT